MIDEKQRKRLWCIQQWCLSRGAAFGLLMNIQGRPHRLGDREHLLATYISIIFIIPPWTALNATLTFVHIFISSKPSDRRMYNLIAWENKDEKQLFPSYCDKGMMSWSLRTLGYLFMSVKKQSLVDVRCLWLQTVEELLDDAFAACFVTRQAAWTRPILPRVQWSEPSGAEQESGSETVKVQCEGIERMACVCPLLPTAPMLALHSCLLSQRDGDRSRASVVRFVFSLTQNIKKMDFFHCKQLFL